MTDRIGPRLTPDERYYVVGDHHLPRVSTILAMIHSQWLEDWQRDKGWEEADRIGREAADYGTLLHAACEAINYDIPLVKRDPEAEYAEEDGYFTDAGSALDAMADEKPARFLVDHECWESANRWGEYKAANVERVLYAEHLVWSTQYGFAGSLDNCLLMKDGRVVLGDFKSSKWIKWPYRLQLAAYGVGLWQTEHVKPDQYVMFDMPRLKPGKLFAIPYRNPKRAWELFEAALKLYQADQEYKDDWKLAWKHEWKDQKAA